MYTVTLDVPQLEKMTLEEGNQVLAEAVVALGAFATDRITQIANSRLSATLAKRYRDAVQVQKSEHRITITLGDPGVEKMEAGGPGFDMKPFMLRSAKAKQGKNGPYVDVPFEHTLSKRGTGNYVQSAHARGIVKALVKAGLANGQTHTAFKGRWSRTSRWRRVADMKVRPQRTHANLVTFRRVSANSPADSFMMQERQGLKFFETVAQEVDQIKDLLILDILTRHSK